MTRLLIVLGAVTAVGLTACGGDDDKSNPFSPSGGTSGGGTGGGGTSAGGTSGTGASGGTAGQAGGGGSSGSGGSAGGTAGSGGTTGGTGGSGGVGGTGGIGGAIGPEQCTDGLDNDQNGKTDCTDAACSAPCASACAAPTVLADPGATQGNTQTHKDSLNNSCGAASSGPDLAYEITAAKSGVFEAIVGGFTPLTMSIRSACSGSELACTKTKSVKVPVTAGTKLWVIVDGASAADAGPFGLSVESRPIACGDKHTDGTETCDDGNTTSGDGCSSTCSFEIKETEPNDTVAQANAWVPPFTATIANASDVDVVKVTVTTAGTTLSATVSDMGDGACEQDKIDSYLELVDKDGDTAIGSDDNSGEGLCSGLSKTNLAPGTYYLFVSAAPGASPATFSYKLVVTLS